VRGTYSHFRNSGRVSKIGVGRAGRRRLGEPTYGATPPGITPETKTRRRAADERLGRQNVVSITQPCRFMVDGPIGPKGRKPVAPSVSGSGPNDADVRPEGPKANSPARKACLLQAGRGDTRRNQPTRPACLPQAGRAERTKGVACLPPGRPVGSNRLEGRAAFRERDPIIRLLAGPLFPIVPGDGDKDFPPGRRSGRMKAELRRLNYEGQKRMETNRPGSPFALRSSPFVIRPSAVPPFDCKGVCLLGSAFSNLCQIAPAEELRGRLP
jgi:hypothetical protein